MASSDGNKAAGRNIVEANKDEEVEMLTELSRKVSISEGSNAEEDDFDRDKNGQERSPANSKTSQEMGIGKEQNKVDRIDSGDLTSLNSEVSTSALEEPPAAYKCSCGELFKKSSELAAHKRWSCLLVVKKLQCNICKSWFAHENGLRRHMNNVHKGDFSCTQCELKFHNRIRLTRHWMEVHYDDSKGDKLKCFLCGDDSFKTKFDLEGHLLIHKYNRIHAKKNLSTGNASGDQQGIACIDLSKSLDGCAPTSSHSPHFISRSQTTNATSSSTAAHQRSHLNYSRHPCCSHSHPHCNLDQHHQKSAQGPDTIPTSKSNIASPPSTSGVGDASAPPHHHFSHHHHPPLPFHPHHFPPPPRHHFPHPPHHHHHHPPPPPPSHQHPPHHSTNPPFHPPPFWGASPFPNPQQFPFFKRRCKGKHHHNKWKWKHYFKNMMSQYFSSPWSFGYPEPHADGEYPQMNPQTENQSHSESPNVSMSSAASSTVPTTPEPSELDSVQTSSSFKIVCKFCDQSIEKGKVAQHRLKDCPYICAFNCNACGKMFRNRKKLLQHLSGSCHNLNETETNASASSETSSVSNLQRQLDSVLDFHKSKPSLTSSCSNSEKSRLCKELKCSPSSSNPMSEFYKHHFGSRPSATISEFASIKASDTIQRATAVQNPKSPKLTENEHNEKDDDSCMEEPSLVIDEMNGNPSVIPSTMLNCSVCRVKFNSINMLSLHLQTHITHVTAVQKVQEWKERSVQYFSDSGNTKEDSSVFSDGISTTNTTDSSFQDIGSISAQSSALSTTVESSSLKTDMLTESEKWLKPHHKIKKKNMNAKDSYSCEHCDENFLFKKAFSHHMKQKHPEVKSKLECPVCKKKFSWRKRGQFYERHLSSHYGVTIFKHKCDLCDKTFLEKCKLQAHMAVQHSKAEELLHKCHICGKGYGTKSSLTRHIRHHTGDKPHQCSMCQESFLEKRELTRHMAAHTGQPAFVCIHCSQGFTLKTSLDTHMKRKHSQLPPS